MKKKNFDPDPYWSLTELRDAIYKIDKVQKEGSAEYYLVYFYNDPKDKAKVIDYPWLILVDSKDHDTIITKCCMNLSTGNFGSFETNKEYRKK